MKKIRILLIFIVIILTLFFTNKVLAAEEGTTKLLYQDVTINVDGSITIKEATLLDGEYNGRTRYIEVKNNYATRFTGIYSNFAGNTDIYNGSDMKNIKVYDISQENFNTINDIDKVENVYKEVNRAPNGDYGVYEFNQEGPIKDFKIYCPSDENKVICIEYTITDAVVVHNDVAELYWNFLGEYYEESIDDFQVLIHLPGEDSDVRIWSHGPLTGQNKILDSKTVYFEDKNVESYKPETIRVMFKKELVPLATKKSNVDGKDNILKYEGMMANAANAEREDEKLKLESRAGEAVSELEEKTRMYYYNYAMELVNKLDDTSEEKQNFLERIEKTKDLVNEDWKEDLKYSLESLTDSNYMFLTRSRLDDFKEDIEEGFDGETKEKYLTIYEDLENILETKQAIMRRNFTIFVIITNVALGIFAIYKLIKVTNERHMFKDHYYRDFPSKDNPNVLEYLMKRKSTNIGFSATILNLINKKVISYEKNPKGENITLIYENEGYTGTSAEAVVLDVMFNMVGKDNKCNMTELKNYGKSTSKAKRMIKKIDEFKKVTEEEAGFKEYFKGNGLSIAYTILTSVNYIFSLFMAFGVFYGLNNYGLQVLAYLIGVSIINIIYLIIGLKDKNRTLKGKEEYSKWLAHKRFLKDFSNFDEKDLPEITLWEKYLVTAMVLGCADKVEKKMKMYITDTSDINTNLLIYQSINLGITRQLNDSVRTAISTSSSSISTSSYSSGGGFGGGSSGGGGRRRPEAAVEVVSRKTKNKRK